MELKREPLNMAHFLKEVVGSLHVFADKRKIKMSIKADRKPLQSDIDKDRITQVIINLTMNAIKFTPEGGKINIALSRPSTKYAQVSVQGTGPGIAQEEANMLFNRFKQLVSPGAMKGAGLGLAISKAIVEMHGGKIWVESKPGKGSTFNFTLPYAG